MLKLYFGNSSAIISTILAFINLGYVIWAYRIKSPTEKWGLVILGLVLLNGALWYFSNVRDQYSNSIVYAIDGSVADGLFSLSSKQSIIYWVTSCLIWLAAIVAIFKPNYRQGIFNIMVVCACVQLLFIEGSRFWLYQNSPTSFNYM